MDFAFGLIACIIGVLIIVFGNNCIKTAEETAKLVIGGSADTFRQLGRNAIRFGIFIIVGGIIGAIVINQAGGDYHSTTPTYANSKSHNCAICGKAGARQITNQAGDNNYYCTEHYADAWQHYYGN